jgi:hypothetical protein
MENLSYNFCHKVRKNNKQEKQKLCCCREGPNSLGVTKDKLGVTQVSSKYGSIGPDKSMEN